MTLSLFLGLALGAGSLLVFTAFWDRGQTQRKSRPRPSRLEKALLQAGLSEIRPAYVMVVSFILAALVGLVVLALTSTIPIAVIFGLFSGMLPLTLIHWIGQRRQSQLRALWPDAVDHLRSATRAGLSLPEALSQLGTHGPGPLQQPFIEFGKDYRSGMSFNDSLNCLQDRLADPVADRLCAALKLTREVGGTELGQLLSTLAAFLREDLRTRNELSARQSWTINGARLAVGAPWVVLLLVCLQPTAAQSYQSPQGMLILVIGFLVCVVCYRLMLRIGTLPEEERILQS